MPTSIVGFNYSQPNTTPNMELTLNKMYTLGNLFRAISYGQFEPCLIQFFKGKAKMAATYLHTNQVTLIVPK